MSCCAIRSAPTGLSTRGVGPSALLPKMRSSVDPKAYVGAAIGSPKCASDMVRRRRSGVDTRCAPTRSARRHSNVESCSSRSRPPSRGNPKVVTCCAGRGCFRHSPLPISRCRSSPKRAGIQPRLNEGCAEARKPRRRQRCSLLLPAMTTCKQVNGSRKSRQRARAMAEAIYRARILVDRSAEALGQ